MIKDYNNTAYLSVKKFRSSKRSVKSLGCLTGASLQTLEKLQPPCGITATGYCGCFVVFLCASIH